MSPLRVLGILALSLASGSCGSPPNAASGSVDRLYVMDCGHNAALDQSRWSPGVNVGKPIELSDNCYLIRHGAQWLLWDTGYPDAIVGRAVKSAIGTSTRSKALVAQLDEAGVRPSDITWVAVSHTHGDHVGNVDLFPQSTLLIQKAEVDWAFEPGKQPPFKRDRPTRQLEGDLDVFGDGSVTILSTPGHTPGHQSLLVHLRQTGWVVLSGDLAHFRDNWDHRRVPSINTSAEETLASMNRVAAILQEKHAQFWINHDDSESLAQKHSPSYYD
jgi:glyoxylase-like metal-dependent hydrolase (beta-lactamase superfamily II)